MRWQTNKVPSLRHRAVALPMGGSVPLRRCPWGHTSGEAHAGLCVHPPSSGRRPPHGGSVPLASAPLSSVLASRPCACQAVREGLTGGWGLGLALGIRYQSVWLLGSIANLVLKKYGPIGSWESSKFGFDLVRFLFRLNRANDLTQKRENLDLGAAAPYLSRRRAGWSHRQARPGRK
jgi:hypothetical protein